MLSIRLESVHDQATVETWHNTKVSDTHVLRTPRTLIGPARDTPQAGVESQIHNSAEESSVIFNVIDLNVELRLTGTQFLNIVHCRHSS
jgi:hypothetical protein